MFTSPQPVEDALAQTTKAAVSHAFAILAYCFMPDHLHLLVEGTSEDSDLLAFVHTLKQRTAYEYRRSHSDAPWPKGYYEHVVRDDETTLDIARCMLANPVRGGLVREPRDYPFSGSLALIENDSLSCGSKARPEGRALHQITDTP
jgi:putative transposase